jgi:hypothetical protein
MFFTSYTEGPYDRFGGGDDIKCMATKVSICGGDIDSTATG